MKIDVFCVLIAYKKELRAKRCYALAVCCIFRLSYMHSWWTYVVAWLWSLDLHNNHSISLPSPFWKEFEFWNFCEKPLQRNVQIVLFALRCGSAPRPKKFHDSKEIIEWNYIVFKCAVAAFLVSPGLGVKFILKWSSRDWRENHLNFWFSTRSLEISL